MVGEILAMEKETAFLFATFWRLCRGQYLYVTVNSPEICRRLLS